MELEFCHEGINYYQLLLDTTLTQEETLGLAADMIYFMCNWKKADGTRGASEEMGVLVTTNQKNEVI